MFVFLRLLLGHLLADFALQTDYVYQMRLRYSWGVIFHSAIFAFFAIICLTPYLSFGRTWLALLVLLGTHTLFDKLKINYLVSTGEDNIWWFFLDQFLHLAVLIGVSIILNPLDAIDLTGVYHGIYYSDLFFKFANSYVFALFFPVAFIYYIEKTCCGTTRNVLYPSAHLKYTGVLERLATLSFLIAGGVYYFFIPLPLLFSWFLQKTESSSDKFLYPRLVLSLTSCLLTSWWLLSR